MMRWGLAALGVAAAAAGVGWARRAAGRPRARGARQRTRLVAGGAPVTVTVWADRPWNATGIAVAAGEAYLLRASGTWTDWFVHATPDGIALDEVPRLARLVYRVFARARRAPEAPWFALVGALGPTERTAFAIGRGRTWTAPADGELHAFANDVPFAYWNNRGTLQLTIERSA